MIDIENLHKSFGDVHVLKGIDLNIKEKEVVAIIGPSGSGKSTLLRCMNYLEEPTQGNVCVDGILLDGEANINKVRAEVGMVFQRFNLFPHMTVLQNVMDAPLVVQKRSRSEVEEQARALIAKMGIFNLVEIDAARQDLVMADEEATLEFGLDWLELVFFGRQERLRRKRHDI